MQPDSRHDDRSALPGTNPVSRLAARLTRRFGADKRGAAEVIGAILMFGLVMSLLVLIQVNAVPAQNQQVEFEHNQRVQQDMLDLDRALLQSGTENVPTSTQIELAARYPTRFFLLNYHRAPGCPRNRLALPDPVLPPEPCRGVGDRRDARSGDGHRLERASGVCVVVLGRQ
ncbi:hypothetical protein ACFQGE_12810 [Halomicroarcula sp. GCM10025817]|uniref:hypothetical protein n=1 Tax=Haloarcula TaxID=2237 RepID=UPI0023E8B40A|nr:hypothetical protein [Halomicroarcula sp. SYNS111]